jgi:hypothetical protein
MKKVFWTSHFLRVRHGFIYPVMSKRKQPRLSSDWSSWDRGYTITWTEGWCIVRHITKSDNRPHILLTLSTRNFTLKRFFTHFLALKGGRNCPRLFPTGRCYWNHSSCSHDATARCVPGQNNFKGDLATTVTRSLHSVIIICGAPWLLSVGRNERSSLQRQSSHYPWTEGSYHRFHQEYRIGWIL